MLVPSLPKGQLIVGPLNVAQVDRTAQRRAAQLVGSIEQVRKELERFDSRQRGDQALTPELQQSRQKIADKAAAAIAEINSLGAGYEAGTGEKGYPYYKQGGEQSTPSPQSTPAARKGFSIGAYLQRNQGATEADARAYAAQKFPNVPVVP